MSWEKENVMFHFVEKWARNQPDAEALVFNDERLTWQQFKHETDRIAKAYLSAGVTKGDIVAVLSMARNEFMTTYMAAGKVGAVWLGLNPKSTIDELRYMISDCRPKILIMVRNFMGNDLSQAIVPLQKEFEFLEKVLVIGDAFEGAENFHEFIQKDRTHLNEKLEKLSDQVKSSDKALLMYTSGSTGKPKGVVHTHSSIIENIRVEVDAFQFNDRVRALLHFPINHVAADVEIGFAAVMSGGCLVFMDGFDPEASLKMIEKEKLTLLGQVPIMFLMQMMQPAFKETDLSSLKLIAWAGAAAPKIMFDGLSAVCQKTGAQLITGYGSTEVCGFVTYTELNDDPDLLLKSVGKIAHPFEMKIVDDQRNRVGTGKIGEIAVKGSFMFKEYLNKPEETAKVFDKDGWYYTDDLGHIDGQGNLFITGRKSEMFKTGGENVYPREVEEVLESHPGVLFAAVIGARDDIYQEVGWAFIMLQPGQEAKEEELVTLCKEKLSNFKVPKRFFIRPLLPLLPTGKVNKVELKKEMETC